MITDSIQLQNGMQFTSTTDHLDMFIFGEPNRWAVMYGMNYPLYMSYGLRRDAEVYREIESKRMRLKLSSKTRTNDIRLESPSGWSNETGAQVFVVQTVKKLWTAVAVSGEITWNRCSRKIWTNLRPSKMCRLINENRLCRTNVALKSSVKSPTILYNGMQFKSGCHPVSDDFPLYSIYGEPDAWRICVEYPCSLRVNRWMASWSHDWSDEEILKEMAVQGYIPTDRVLSSPSFWKKGKMIALLLFDPTEGKGYGYHPRWINNRTPMWYLVPLTGKIKRIRSGSRADLLQYLTECSFVRCSTLLKFGDYRHA